MNWNNERSKTWNNLKNHFTSTLIPLGSDGESNDEPKKFSKTEKLNNTFGIVFFTIYFSKYLDILEWGIIRLRGTRFWWTKLASKNENRKQV